MELFLFAIWEASLLFFSLALAKVAIDGSVNGASQGLMAALTLAFKLFLGGVIPQTAVFLGPVSAPILMSVAFILLASAGGLAWAHRGAWFRSEKDIPPAQDAAPIFLSALALVALTPAITATVTPITESDSTAYSPEIIGLLSGETNPLHFIMNYVALWEASYLPSFVLTKSIVAFPFVSLQATLLFGCAAFALARAANASPILSALLAIAGVCSGHLWGYGPSGAATLKNDAIFGAGLLCFITGAIRIGRFSISDLAGIGLAAAGAALASVKFLGVANLAVILLVFALVWWRRLIEQPMRTLAVVGVGVAVWISASGFYYIIHWIWYGNPVAPFEVSIGPIHFSGSLDLSGTTLLDHVSDPQMWRYLFGFDYAVGTWPFVKGGPFLFVLFFGSLLSIFPFAVRIQRGDRNWRTYVFIYLTCIACWYLYMRSFWTAGGDPNDLGYISWQVSLRYALGPIQVALTTFALAIASFGRIGRVMACGLVGLELAGRAFVLYLGDFFKSWASIYDLQSPLWPVSYFWIALAIASAAITILLCRRFFMAGFAAFGLISLGLAPATYDANAINHGSRFGVVDDLKLQGDLGRAYALRWPESERKLKTILVANAYTTIGSRRQFAFAGVITPDQLEHEPALSRQAEAIVVSCAPDLLDLSTGDLDLIDARLSPLGYSLISTSSCAALFLRTDRARHLTP
jgi:hypothetical protein